MNGFFIAFFVLTNYLLLHVKYIYNKNMFVYIIFICIQLEYKEGLPYFTKKNGRLFGGING